MAVRYTTGPARVDVAAVQGYNCRRSVALRAPPAVAGQSHALFRQVRGIGTRVPSRVRGPRRGLRPGGSRQPRHGLGAHRAQRRPARAGRRAASARPLVRGRLLHPRAARPWSSSTDERTCSAPGDYGAVKVGHAARVARRRRRRRCAGCRWRRRSRSRTAPSATRSSPRTAPCRSSAPPLDLDEPARQPARATSTPARFRPSGERQNVAQGPRGRVPEVADRREVRRRAPPAAVHRVPAGRQHRPARPHVRRGLLHPERRGRGDAGRQDVYGPTPATCCGPASAASTRSPTSAASPCAGSRRSRRSRRRKTSFRFMAEWDTRARELEG